MPEISHWISWLKSHRSAPRSRYHTVHVRESAVIHPQSRERQPPANELLYSECHVTNFSTQKPLEVSVNNFEEMT